MRSTVTDGDDQLQFEILRSEQLRSRALMGIFAFLFVLSGLVLVAWPRSSNPLYELLGDEFPARAIVAFYGIGALYELAISTILGRVLARRMRPPEPIRYINALIETSYPTILLMLIASASGPEIALNSPLAMVYFLLISLSTLRLGAPLSIFTGCVAAAEFAALGTYWFPPGSTDFVTSRLPIYLKALVMIVAGVVCGFVGAQIRERLVAFLRLVSEKNRVLGMFGQYVSPAVVDELLTKPIDDEGEERHVTVMFLDIRGFTSFAEQRSAREVVEYLNVLFSRMIKVVNDNHGIINKFLGDGFMACFGAPLSSGRDAENAVRAALEITKAVEDMNVAGAIVTTRIGIGLHAGPAITGSVGSSERREYTIIGDTVNLASRVEQLTKQVGCAILVTQPVWERVKDEFTARALDPMPVKGRQQPVAVYALS